MTYESAATPNLNLCHYLCHCYGMKAKDAVSNQQNSEKRKAHVVTFAKVLDGRKQPIRGLWIRGTRYYARLNVENPLSATASLFASASEGSSPATGTTSNCECSNDLGDGGSTTDTKTDTIFLTPLDTGVTGAYSPDTR